MDNKPIKQHVRYAINSSYCNYRAFSYNKYLVEDTKIDNIYNYKALKKYALKNNNPYIADEADFSDCFYDIFYNFRTAEKKSMLKSLSLFLGYCGLGSVVRNLKTIGEKAYSFKYKKVQNAFKYKVHYRSTNIRNIAIYHNRR